MLDVDQLPEYAKCGLCLGDKRYDEMVAPLYPGSSFWWTKNIECPGCKGVGYELCLECKAPEGTNDTCWLCKLHREQHYKDMKHLDEIFERDNKED